MSIPSFADVRFPVDVALGASGGPQRDTRIVRLASGHEHRNQRRAHAIRRYEAGYGVADLKSLHAVLAFYEARRGPLIAFRYRDPLDWKSCDPGGAPSSVDQTIGVGDGSDVTFRLSKGYGDGAEAYRRPITRPVAGSVTVAVDGLAITPDGIDHENGTVTLATPPASGAIVTAGFAFDVPVRFESDQLSVSLTTFQAGEIPSIPLIEVLE